jgi:general secretion pathway protein E/type IV pilus assembly protein PilB
MSLAAISSYRPLPEGAEQYPLEFIESQGAIKLAENSLGKETGVTIGITEKTTQEAKQRLRFFHKQEVRFVEIDPMELSAYLSGRLGEIEGGDQKEAEGGDPLLLDRLANDAPVINLVNSICIDGIRSGASDIQIEAGNGPVRIRYRIDGSLRTIRTLDHSRFQAISSRIKVMANLNILERRQPQDGRITVSAGEERIDLRISIVPVTGGESIVLRILGKKAALSSLEELGFTEAQLFTLRCLLSQPHGLILMTGPTGSGKTTTLNAMLGELVSDRVKIITIEDPVEFLVEGVNQIQINERIGLGFDTLLRRILRQDPNIIMIGEIRDTATAEIALRAGLTGHLVLSTLHTNDAASVIPRLINMGVEPFLIASVLRGAAAQRLVRKLCPYCREAREINPEENRLLDLAGIQTHTLYSGKGCPACGFTGFSGRTVIAEIFTQGESGSLEDQILRRENINSITNYLRQRGMKSLLREGLEKAAAGITTIEEVTREIIINGAEP